MVCGWLPGEEWQLGVESKTSGSTCKPSDTLMDDALFERAAVMLALGADHPIAFKLDPISTETTVELCALAKQAAAAEVVLSHSAAHETRSANPQG